MYVTTPVRRPGPEPPGPVLPSTDGPQQTRNGRDACAPLLSLAVHELRTPAGVVQGYLHMLQQIARGHARRAPAADGGRSRAIVRAAHCRIVAEIGEFARLEAGTEAFASEPLDLFDARRRPPPANLQEGADRGIRFSAGRRGRRRADLIGRSGASQGRALDRLLRAAARAGASLRRRRRPPDCRRSRRTRRASSRWRRPTTSSAVVDTASEPFDDRRSGLGFALVIAARVVAAHGGRLWSPADRTRGAVVIEFPLPD